MGARSSVQAVSSLKDDKFAAKPRSGSLLKPAKKVYSMKMLRVMSPVRSSPATLPEAGVVALEALGLLAVALDGSNALHLMLPAPRRNQGWRRSGHCLPARFSAMEDIGSELSADCRDRLSGRRASS